MEMSLMGTASAGLSYPCCPLAPASNSLGLKDLNAFWNSACNERKLAIKLASCNGFSSQIAKRLRNGRVRACSGRGRREITSEQAPAKSQRNRTSSREEFASREWTGDQKGKDNVSVTERRGNLRSKRSKRDLDSKPSRLSVPNRSPTFRDEKNAEFASEAAATSDVEMCWRLFNIEVPVSADPGKDFFSLHEVLHEAVATRLGCQQHQLSPTAIKVLRKSFDARKDPKFVYAVDVEEKEIRAALTAANASSAKLFRLPQRASRVPSVQDNALNAVMGLHSATFTASPLSAGGNAEEDVQASRRAPNSEANTLGDSTKHWSSTDSILNEKRDPVEDTDRSSLEVNKFDPFHPAGDSTGNTAAAAGRMKKKVVVVGSGPAGLFAALVLSESGHKVVLLERGQPVEVRGRDIGAFVVRRQMDANSNFCYGEGGAGTWSDGKLTTRIGKNSSEVQAVLRALVHFGAPERICVDGKPHLGTDRLVRILQNFRNHLLQLGVEIHFGTVMEDLEMQNGRLVGVRVAAVSSLFTKPSTSPTGRHDHRLGQTGVMRADSVVLAVGHSARDVYAVLQRHGVEMSIKDFAVGFRVEHPQELINNIQYGEWASAVENGKGKIPVADYSLAVNIEGEGMDRHGCYSFCMCPGGQVVSTSTDENELCINGMSFSRRSSKWANAALVATVSAADFAPYMEHGALAGVAFQRTIEREAAVRGGGAFVVPVQRVTDFLDGRLSEEPLPASSYRLGVRSARLDDLYPPGISTALKKALLAFDRQMPGFVCSDALLHGVETRTSSPVRIERCKETFESVSMAGLVPVGEGAGYAGGIVSAAVDGMRAGLAVARRLAAALG